MLIDDIHIAEAERLLIGNNHFDQERLDFIKSLDSCDLLAVPGSGKTTALQAKLYCLSKLRPFSSMSGILVLSHTNAAVDEIKKKLSQSCPELFEYPNFVGTIQDFVDTFLAIPYYNCRYSHAITSINTTICKEEFMRNIQNKWIRKDNIWTWYRYNAIEQAKNFSIKVSVDGNIVPWNYVRQKEFIVAPTKTPKTWKGVEEENRKHILNVLCELKLQLFERGILSYEDCYAFAQLYINRFPRIKSIIRSRFKYVFIDETQDLQGFQLEIADQLFCDDSVCFQRIGDVNQSIFHAGVDSTDCVWKTRNVRIFNNSLRLTPSVASFVDAFMFRREDGQMVKGVRDVNPEINPYILVYDYSHKHLLKTQFEKLIKLHGLNDIPEKKYGFHIVGWNTKWSETHGFNPNELRLFDLFPEYTSTETYTGKSRDSLSGYISIVRTVLGNKERMSIINEMVCECLRMCNKYDSSNKPFTPASLLKYLENECNCLQAKYKSLVFNVVKLIVLSQLSDAYDKMRVLVDWLLSELGVAKSPECTNFLSKPYVQITEMMQQEHSQIHVETVHCAKGQTHCATLYIETMYQGKYESIHVFNREKRRATRTKSAVYYSNPFYKEYGIKHDSSYAQSAMKMLYVGLSRPTHLLCYAMHKSSFELYNVDMLKNSGWQIVDLTVDSSIHE